MNDKLKVLTNKIYSEGIEKAEKDAAEITEKAKKESEALLSEAEDKAQKILQQAKTEAESLRKNIESELKLASNQSISSLKQKITDIIVSKIANKETETILKDKDLVSKLIEKIIDNSINKDENQIDIIFTIPEKEKNNLDKYFNEKQKALLDKGIQVNFSTKFEAGFEIAPKDNKYKISFTDESFEEFFKNYLRPQTKKLLFG